MKVEIDLKKELDAIRALVTEKLRDVESPLKVEERNCIRDDIVNNYILTNPSWISAMILEEGLFQGFFNSKTDRLISRSMRELNIEMEKVTPAVGLNILDTSRESAHSDDDEGGSYDSDTSQSPAPFTSSRVPPKPPLGDLRARAIDRFKGDTSLDRKYLTYTDRRDWYNDVFYDELGSRGHDGDISKYLLAHLPKPPPGKEHIRISELVSPDQFIEIYRKAIEYANNNKECLW